MKVLLTNDDGYQSPGMTAARDALLAAGLQVLTVAPDGPRSGTSRSASFRLPIVMVLVGGDARNPIYKTNGTPTDCVRVAILSGLAHDIDAVVSGINEGANLGDDATYSSTLGSAIEGALLGFPSIAGSQQSRDGRFRLVDLTGYDYDWGAKMLAELVTRMIAAKDSLPPRSVLNFNAPAAPASHIQVTPLDRRIWKAGQIKSVETETGTGWILFGTDAEWDPIFEHRPGTDSWAVREGNASVTALNFAWDVSAARSRLLRWTRAAVNEINQTLSIEAVS